MIEATNLSRSYGDFTAVDGVSFTVNEGEIVGILGPNGAGKTTTIRMVTGFLPPSGGQVSVSGVDLFDEPAKARQQIGYLPENVSVYPEMRVEEYLNYRAQLVGMARGEIGSTVAEAMDACLITDVRRQIVGTLSKGYRQRIGLAAAILHRPDVLVLDEPTVGLDPKQIVAIRERIRELGRKHTILLSTHILPEVELLCSRVLIIDRGKIVAEGTPENLRREWSGPSGLRLELLGRPESALDSLQQLDGVDAAVVTGDRSQESGDLRLRLAVAGDQDLRAEVFSLAVAKGWTILEMTREQASLEDIFVRLTTRDGLENGPPNIESAVDEAAAAEGAVAESGDEEAAVKEERIDQDPVS